MSIYVDIVVAAIFALAIIVGVIKGFAKQFTGGFCGLVGLFGSIALTLLIMPLIVEAGILNGFYGAAAGWFGGEAFIAPIGSMDDLVTVLSSSGFLSILKAENISGRIWTTMSEQQMTTLGQYFGALCARLIVGFIMWVVLLLIFKLIFFGIRKGLERLARLPVLNTLNRIFGAIWSILTTYIIFVVFITTAVEIVIIKWLPEGALEALRDIVNNATVFQVLHDTNIIGAYIAQLFNVDLSALAPIIA